MRRRSATGSCSRTDAPNTRTSPASASSNRLARRSAVVLPQPDGPTSAIASPGETESVRPSTAGFEDSGPKLLRTSMNSRAGAGERVSLESSCVNPSYDAVVIGGGPGGSTVATTLARKGRSVLVVEREKFPRFHVGESLLPFSLPIFDRLGVHDKIRAHGFQRKFG